MIRKSVSIVFLFLFSMMLCACGSRSISSSRPLPLSPHSRILVAPFANNSETASAGKRGASLVAGLLRSKGLLMVDEYPMKESCQLLSTCPDATVQWKKLKSYALSHHDHYIVMGTVNEWRYKIGLDGEPSIGATITIKNLDDQIVWTSVGSATGKSWSGLSNTAQQLLSTMLGNILIQ